VPPDRYIVQVVKKTNAESVDDPFSPNHEVKQE
jgi:hypothetical protein